MLRAPRVQGERRSHATASSAPLARPAGTASNHRPLPQLRGPSPIVVPKGTRKSRAVGATAWLVTFRGNLSDDARGALSAVGTIVTGGHGGGFVGPGGDSLEPLENHTVLVDADTERDAIMRVRRALRPHGRFGAFSAHESGAP